MVDTNPYILKTVSFRFNGADLRLDLSHALFSSNDIDAGSKLLLKAVAKATKGVSIRSVLDIGCGTGVLGLACAKAYPQAQVVLRDRDALACAFTEHNARINKVKPLAVQRALFLDGLSGAHFDLVLSNVPAKAGAPVLDHFFRELPSVLAPSGLCAVVVVNSIADAARASLESVLPALDDGVARVVLAERGAGHSVFVFRGPASSALQTTEPSVVPPLMLEPSVEPTPEAMAVYRRTSLQDIREPSRYRHNGYWGLAEFDTPSFATLVAMNLAIEQDVHLRRVAVVNPGSGRLACMLRSRHNARVDLCGRDFLALSASASNLAQNGSAQAEAGKLAVAWPDELEEQAYDMVAEYLDVTPRVDTCALVWAHALRCLKPGGLYLAVASSADMERFEKYKPKGCSLVRSKRKKGWAAQLWRLEG